MTSLAERSTEHQILVAVGVGRDHPIYEEAVGRVRATRQDFRPALGRLIADGLVEPVGLRLTVAGNEAAYAERRA